MAGIGSNGYGPNTAVAEHTFERDDLIPYAVNAETVAAAGQSESFIVNSCNQLGITGRDLKELLGIRDVFQTPFQTLVALIREKKLSVPEVGIVCDLRYRYSKVGPNGIFATRDTPTYLTLVNFYRTFGSSEMDADDIESMIGGLVEDLKGSYPTSFVLEEVTKIAERRGISDLCTVIDYANNELPDVFQDDLHPDDVREDDLD